MISARGRLELAAVDGLAVALWAVRIAAQLYEIKDAPARVRRFHGRA